MRNSILICAALGLVAGVWNCDSIWSSSVVDCGRPGFKCPDGYTPPGQDLSMSDSDGGGGGGPDGGGSGSDMGQNIPAGYSSVFVQSDSARTTLVGTSDGRVRTYASTGTGTLVLAGQLTELAGTPIVGIWRGTFGGTGSPIDYTIVVPNANKFYTHINTSPGVPQDTSRILNAIWSRRRNGNNNEQIYSTTKMYLAANGGRVIEFDVQLSPGPTLSALTDRDLQVASNINAVGGLQSAGGLDTNRMCMPMPCANTDVVWAAGDGGKLFNRNDAGWHEITNVIGTVPSSARFFGIASVRTTPSAAPQAFAVGQDGVFVERPSGDASQWQTAASPPFGTKTMNAICFFDDNEAWAVGDGGAIYHYLTYDGPPMWIPVTLGSLGKDLSTVSLRAVHCSERFDDGMVTARDRRVTIVGSNNTLFYGEDSSQMGINYTWKLVE